MRYVVERSKIQVIGYIWWPNNILCAASIPVSAHDRENIGELTRENVARWLMCHSGDFSSVVDFRADFSYAGEGWESPWSEEESEWKYWDCVGPEA